MAGYWRREFATTPELEDIKAAYPHAVRSSVYVTSHGPEGDLRRVRMAGRRWVDAAASLSEDASPSEVRAAKGIQRAAARVADYYAMRYIRTTYGVATRSASQPMEDYLGLPPLALVAEAVGLHVPAWVSFTAEEARLWLEDNQAALEAEEVAT